MAHGQADQPHRARTIETVPDTAGDRAGRRAVVPDGDAQGGPGMALAPRCCAVRPASCPGRRTVPSLWSAPRARNCPRCRRRSRSSRTRRGPGPDAGPGRRAGRALRPGRHRVRLLHRHAVPAPGVRPAGAARHSGRRGRGPAAGPGLPAAAGGRLPGHAGPGGRAAGRGETAAAGASCSSSARSPGWTRPRCAPTRCWPRWTRTSTR